MFQCSAVNSLLQIKIRSLKNYIDVQLKSEPNLLKYKFL